MWRRLGRRRLDASASLATIRPELRGARAAQRLVGAVDLRKRFGGVLALDGASLDVAANEVHCLIGPNGAGKSTFFNLLTGRYRPTAGRSTSRLGG